MSSSVGQVIHQRLKRVQLTVGIFSAQAAVLEHHLSIIDITAQAPPAYGKPVLAFARPDTFEFPYAMLMTPIVGIGAEYLDGLCIHGGKVRMVSEEHAQQPIKVARGADGKGRRHAFLTLGGFATLLGLEFGQELVRGAALSGEVFLTAGVDMRTDFRVLEFEIVFKLIDVHKTGNRDAILLQDDVFLVKVHPFNHGSEVNARLSNGETVNYRR